MSEEPDYRIAQTAFLWSGGVAVCLFALIVAAYCKYHNDPGGVLTGPSLQLVVATFVGGVDAATAYYLLRCARMSLSKDEAKSWREALRPALGFTLLFLSCGIAIAAAGVLKVSDYSPTSVPMQLITLLSVGSVLQLPPGLTSLVALHSTIEKPLPRFDFWRSPGRQRCQGRCFRRCYSDCMNDRPFGKAGSISTAVFLLACSGLGVWGALKLG